jgi:small neutral amino acid transporter SnatA (MarC family)
LHHIQQCLKKTRGRPCLGWRTRLAVVFTLGLGILLDVGIASAAATPASPAQERQFTAAYVFTFLFLMLGPFKIIAPFSRIIRGADTGLIRKIAVLSILFSSLALLLAALLGERILSSYGIPVPVLALSAGIILFLVALKGVLEQFAPTEQHDERLAPPEAPTLRTALAPLAFPTIVTPYGIAALVVFLALSQSLESRLTIGAVVVAIMLLNLIVMLVTRRLLPVLAFVLPVLGAVLGVVQVALGLQIINNSLRALGVL